MSDTPATPTVPWAADATQDEAQAAFDVVLLKYRKIFDAIGRGEEVRIVCPSIDVVRAMGLALKAQCASVWGQEPVSFVVTGREIAMTPPSGPPPQPKLCGACGQALAAGCSSLRWASPGLAGAAAGRSGWEHRCVSHVPQAGHFPTDFGEAPFDAAAVGAMQAEQAACWKEAAIGRVRAGDEYRGRNWGHLFAGGPLDTKPPHCSQCGLAATAFMCIPEPLKWRCPGEPAPAPATSSVAPA